LFLFCSRRFQGGARHQGNHLSESGEALILSLAAVVTNVDLGDDDGQAKESKGMIKMG
jgi:hypothetical protein